MSQVDPNRTLKALRALYMILEFPFRDEVTDEVARLGRRFARAVDHKDIGAMRHVRDDAIEWARKMRHVIASRLEKGLGG